jgi:signal transduction histidine kinase
MALTAREILNKRPSDVAWKLIEMSAPTYDYRELQAWGIDLKRLPPGSVIRFKPPTVWEMYPGWIALIVLIIIVQIALIVSLVLQHKHRRRAELQGIQLGRRLISAQEDERRLLARELHDDLSQRLARLAIDTAYVAANPGSAKAIEVLRGLQPELVSISKDVHNMSYRLHPSLLNDLGLVAALQTECERVQRYTDAAIVAQLGDVREKIPADKALCVYRITQEAVNNAIRYADAGIIEITLAQQGRSLVLSVRDDGKGFDPAAEDMRAGLGLLSMRERAQLEGGSWAIESQPGKGTTVTVVLPLQGASG